MNGRNRSAKQIRGRWHNYLNPDIKKSKWSYEEELKLVQLVHLHGNKWSQISRNLHGRNENMVKNHYNSLLRKIQTNKYSGVENKDIFDKLLQSLKSDHSALQNTLIKNDQETDSENNSYQDKSPELSMVMQHTPPTVTKRIQKVDHKMKKGDTLTENFKQEVQGSRNREQQFQDIFEQQSRIYEQKESKQINNELGSENFLISKFQKRICDTTANKQTPLVNTKTAEISACRELLKSINSNFANKNGQLNPEINQYKQTGPATTSQNHQIQIQPQLFQGMNQNMMAASTLSCQSQENIFNLTNTRSCNYEESWLEDIFFEGDVPRVFQDDML